MRPLATSTCDDEAKVFLERTLGLEKANPLFATTVPVWRWSVRWVRPLEKLEYRAAVSPDGRSSRSAGSCRRRRPRPTRATTARARSRRRRSGRDRGLDPASRFGSSRRASRSVPRATDRTFVWESNTIRFGDAALRYLVEVQGDRVGRSSLHLEVPEKWRRDYETLRSKNLAAGTVATFGLLLTALAVLVVFLERVRRKDVKWKLGARVRGTGAALQLLASLNELPIRLFDYETSDGWAGFVAKSVAGDVGARRRASASCSLPSRRGRRAALPRDATRTSRPSAASCRSAESRSKRFFRGLLLGYAMTAFFFAYQVVFYIVAERTSARGLPPTCPYSNLLGTSFPWLGVLLMGFVPATTEEFSSRMFSISVRASGSCRAGSAVVVPALIWGFAHSTYPNQPFYIRGVEVGFAGILIGVVMLKADIFPLLVWHFTVDAVYTALLLVRSSNPYFVVSGAAASLVLLLPLGVVARPLSPARRIHARRRPHERGRRDRRRRRRACAEAVPLGCAPPRALDPAPRRARGRPRARGLVRSPRASSCRTPDAWDDVSVTVDRNGAKAAADAWLKAAGDDPAGYLSAVTTATALPGSRGPLRRRDGPRPVWRVGARRSAGSSSAAACRFSRSGRRRFCRDRSGTSATCVPSTSTARRSRWTRARAGSSAFRRTFPEAEPGASPDEAAARAKAAEVLASFGDDPHAGTVVSSRAKQPQGAAGHASSSSSRVSSTPARPPGAPSPGSRATSRRSSRRP